MRALLLYALAGLPPGRLREAGGQVPRPLLSVCARAMAPEREARYPTARALAADLERYLDGEPVSAHREAFLERAARLARRHQAALLLLASYLLLRLVILFFVQR